MARPSVTLYSLKTDAEIETYVNSLGLNVDRCDKLTKYIKKEYEHTRGYDLKQASDTAYYALINDEIMTYDENGCVGLGYGCDDVFDNIEKILGEYDNRVEQVFNEFFYE